MTPTDIVKITEILDSATPVNDNAAPAANGEPSTTININASDGSVVAVNGSKIRCNRLCGRLVLLVIIFLPFALAIFICLSRQISTARSGNFSAAVIAVAICENKRPNQIHRELKAKYGYNRYSEMSNYSYHIAMWELGRRDCK